MNKKDTLFIEFSLCEEERRAQEIINECRSRDVFAALINIDGDYQQISGNAKNLLGYETSELLNDSMFRMTHRNDKAELFRAFSIAMNKGAMYRFTQRLRCFNGQYLPVITHMKMIDSPQKTEVVFCLVVRA